MYELNQDQARRPEGSVVKFYPLVNKHGKVVEFAELTAKDILYHVNLARDYAPNPDNPDSAQNHAKMEDFHMSTRYFFDGWRPLTPKEYATWKDNGMPLMLDTVREAVVPASMLSDKEDEIAKLRAQIAALEATSKPSKKESATIQPVGDKGGIA